MLERHRVALAEQRLEHLADLGIESGATGEQQAVVGTSRLPLTSVEAPLPAFTFGQLAYFYRSDAGTEPIRSRRASSTLPDESE